MIRHMTPMYPISGLSRGIIVVRQTVIVLISRKIREGIVASLDEIYELAKSRGVTFPSNLLRTLGCVVSSVCY